MPGGDRFRDEFVSAFSEALNNVLIHGGELVAEEIEIEIEFGKDRLTIRLIDSGRSFDPRTVPAPDLDSLPESGLGAFIIRSFVDEIAYSDGPPNVLSMTKLFPKENRR